MLARWRSIFNVLVFLVLTFEEAFTFDGLWQTPWHYVCDILCAPLPGIRIWFLDGITLLAFVTVRGKKLVRTGRVKELDRAAMVSIGAGIAWGIYGYSRGGDAIQMRLQLHTHVMTMVGCLLFTGIYRTAEDFVQVGKVIIRAALFRCGLGACFLWFKVRPTGVHFETMLNHGDTLLLCISTVIILMHALHTRKRNTTMRSVGLLFVMLWGIQMNNRRLAWVSLVGSSIVLYFLLSDGLAKRRLHRVLRTLIPTLSLYIAIGWGRPEKIFKPIDSFAQMSGEKKDLSTESRILENIGLAATVKSSPVVGTGFGWEYIEISDALAPKESYPMYKYDPHNSVVGLLAFMGGLGFYFIWLVYPTIVFYGARAYRAARDPTHQTIAACSVGYIIIQGNQMFGDIGINADNALVLVPLAFAAASRFAVATGAAPGVGGGGPERAAEANRVVAGARVAA